MSQPTKETEPEIQPDTSDETASGEQLQATRRENDLTQELVKAGVNDLEVALLLAEKLLNNPPGEQSDVSKAIDNLRQQRPSLFGGEDESIASVAGPTAGIHTAGDSRQNSLSDSAHQARRTGSRNDVCQYLRLRRVFK